MSTGVSSQSGEMGLSAVEIERLIFERLHSAYFADDRPWVIGFSGGKDSTLLLQCVYRWMLSLPNSELWKPVHVLACDTRVELPTMAAHLRLQMQEVSAAAARDQLPLISAIVSPDVNDTFWVNLIGRGYPSPTIHFRWCTERLKIQPVTKYIENVVDRCGAVNILLGVRADESTARARSLEKHAAGGALGFRPHTDLKNAWVFAPMHDVSTSDVWACLDTIPSPWGTDNGKLRELYLRTVGQEPPLATERDERPVGPGRFGCWTCTVVEEDQMTASLIEAGETHLAPLLAFRNLLRDIREQPGARYDLRRNGARPIHRDSGEVMCNTGPFTHETRMLLLDRLLETQRAIGEQLISAEELQAIQEVWDLEEKGHPEKPPISARAVEMIWRQAEEGVPMTEQAYEPALTEEDQLLEDVCQRMHVPVDLLLKLRSLEEEYGRLRRRHGLPSEMREIVREAALRLEGD